MIVPDPSRSVDNPFNAEDASNIRRLRERLRRLDKLLVNMEECGIECTGHRDIQSRLDTFLESVETRFFRDGTPA